MEGRRVVLYVGLMTKNDSVEVVIEAGLRIVREKQRKDCYIVLLGDGDVRKTLQEQVEKEGMQHAFLFRGIVSHEEVMEYLDVAHVCVAPDLPNGLNEYLTLVKVLEYMKAGKPFVSFDLPETRMIAGEAGMYASNVRDFADKIVELLDDPAEAQRLGALGKARVEREYLWSHSERELCRAYDGILGDS
jgi:glycosyltransferase involved in cell wall biosynthesis